MPRIALYGRPGAGKSTVAGLLTRLAAQRGSQAITVKLAAPLYEIQQFIYSLAGRPMLLANQQDGLLLNALGSHLRRINPESLTEAFTSRVRQAEKSHPKCTLICDDMRMPDVPAVRSLNFRLVEVVASEELRVQRKAMRADLTQGDDTHWTERAIEIDPDDRIVNNGTLASLEEKVGELLDR